MQSIHTHTIQVCRHCGKPLRGRSDKVFCDTICKNDYHSRQLKAERKDTEEIDRILKQNRRALQLSLGAATTRKVAKEQLVREGLRFNYHTHQITNVWREKYSFCYDYGYLVLVNDKYLIFKNDPSEPIY
jgi:hypothetical protein